MKVPLLWLLILAMFVIMLVTLEYNIRTSYILVPMPAPGCIHGLYY
jgi:hypothetical protein